MITNYFTLRALVAEWQDIVGYRLGDAYSHHRGEVTLTFYDGPKAASIVIGTTGHPLYVFRHDGYNRPKRNVVTLFEELFDKPVLSVDIAERDRIISLGLDGASIMILPFGPKANVLIIDERNHIQRALRNEKALIGTSAPAAAPAPDAAVSAEEFTRAIENARGGVARRIRRAVPLFDELMAEEICLRAGVDARAEYDPVIAHKLYDASREVQSELEAPSPYVYYEETWIRHFSLIRLQHLGSEFEEQSVETVTEGVRKAVRSSLARRAFEADHSPLLRALRRETEAAARSVDRMFEELASPSRADTYERYGHLLMANRSEISPGDEQLVVPDLFEGGTVEIPVDDRRSVIENAERYYERARTTRRSREAAETRLDGAIEHRERLEAALSDIEPVRSLKELREAELRHKAIVAGLASKRETAPEARPYRLVNFRGYDILIGRSARLNDRLTFGIASKNDYWLHARGTSGSHVIIRRNRDETLPGDVIERAASLAAWFSKARGSSLVPVIVTERKFVRKPKGALPGAVVVEREQVLMVAPEPVASEE